MDKILPLQTMVKSIQIALLLLFSVAFLSSCDTYQKVLKNATLEQKYDLAIKYYEEGSYTKAAPLLEELITLYKGSQSVEELYFYYANCQFYMDNYYSASFHFKNFFDAYPAGQFAEESLFQHANCFYLLSPKYTLEQSYTYKAIDALQLFVNNFPKSDKVQQCNTMIDQLRRKLEKKAFNAATLYFKTRNYQAAALSFNNLVVDFPDTPYKEEALYMVVRSNFKYAENSVKDKKLERFQDVVASYQDFVDKYKSSKFQKAAEQFYTSALTEIEKIKSDQ